MALGSYLRRRGHRVTLVNQGPFLNREIRHLEQHFRDTLPAIEDDSALIVLDCPHLQRTNLTKPSDKQLPMAIIDHHIPEGTLKAEAAFIQPAAPATAFLIQYIIEAQKDVPNTEEAQLLLLAVASDTGFLRHLPDNSGVSLCSIARLSDAGGSLRNIYHQMYGNRQLTTYQLLARHLERVEQHYSERLLLTYENRQDWDDLQCEERDSDRLFAILSSIKNCEVMILIREEQQHHRCLVSMRSRNYVDVAQAARHYGGGGHRRAAGFSTSSSIEIIRQSLLNHFQKLLK